MTADWGPLSDLARRLGKIAPGILRWEEVAEDLGGLWGLCAPDWPTALPPVRSRAGAAPTLWKGAARIWAPLLRRGGSRRIEPEELARLLVRCHKWMGLRNLRAIASLFGPAWQDLPVGSFAVSPKAVAWTLPAMALAGRGPAAIPRGAALLPARYAPAAGDPLGDALSLHLHVEALVKTAASRLGIAPAEEPLRRRPGGLRTASFLRVYPLFELSGRAANDWKQAIDAFIAASPLTGLVYLDVLGKPFASASLDGVLQPASAADAPDCDPEAGWRELWLSQLARSLVGVMLSPPPLEERWRAAEAAPGAPGAATLRSQMEGQYFQRLALLAALFRPPAVSGRTAPVYLHLRTMDMLVRYLVTVSGEEMEEQWRADSRPSGWDRTHHVVLGGEAPCKALAAALLGTLKKDSSSKDWRRHLDALLSPEVPGEEALARQTGVTRSSARWLIERWSDDGGRSVELPFSPLYSRGWVPAILVEEWNVLLSNSLPQAAVSLTGGIAQE